MRSIRRFLQASILLAATLLAGCGGGGGSTPVKPTHGKWTILVYMNAANGLDVYSPLNVSQMQKVATNPDVRFVVQWKQSTKVVKSSTFNGTRRYLVKPNTTSSAIVSQLVQNMGSGVDMGVPQTLNDFIKWGKTNYPADHYALVVWDHGNGWLPFAVSKNPLMQKPKDLAVSFDGETGHAIDIWQFNQAFQGQHLDIVAFDSSLMQMNEVAYQLQGAADLVAGSEESPPGAGYPYQRVFAAFTNNPDDTPRNLSKAFVDGMLNEPSYADEKIEQSVIDPTQLPGVATAASTLAQALVANSTSVNPIIPQVRTNTQSYSQTTIRYFYDSVDLSNQISALTSVSAVQNACAGFSTAVGNAIVWEGHNSHSPGSHGLSIDFSPSAFFSSQAANYNKLAWNGASNWSSWLSIAP